MTALLAAGYGLGRCRPWMRLARWADWQAHHGRRWVATRPRRSVVRGAVWLTAPGYAWRVRRHRNDPPRQFAPAVRVREDDR